MGPREMRSAMPMPVILDVLELHEKLDPPSDLVPQLASVPSSTSSGASFSVGSLASDEPLIPHETHLRIGSQVLVPFFIAGMGMVAAGIYLDMVQGWPVFLEVPEIIILVPALLGLKGNLEMTLASRLSTESNMGHMDTHKEKINLIIGNLALIQCQAIVVGFLSSLVAIIMVIIVRQEFHLEHALLLCACSIITASVASFALGLVTSGVIVLSRCCKINPDNVATPIAGSLGDITSLVILATCASLMHSVIHLSSWLCPLIIITFVAMIPIWVWITKNNKYTRSVLYNGWTPVVVAMFISTIAGLILDLVVARSRGVAIFQPVINGVGGNLVAVQASKMSTALHKEVELGTLPPNTRVCISPCTVFFSSRPMAVTARVLMFLVIPGHLCFAYTISYVKTQDASLSPIFVVLYLIASLLQVAVLLYVACIITTFFWSRKQDPDSTAIPYLTALGDFLGICLLGITFEMLRLLGSEESSSMP